MRVLVVEDDRIIADQIANTLLAEGHQVDVANDGQTGLRAAVVGTYGLVVLDLMLPKLDGLEVCSQLRRNRSTVPILMLTARDAIDDRVRGLDVGADDYLPKPFDVRELQARVRALLRRDKVLKTGVLTIDDLEIDSSAKTVRRGGKEVHLTPREFSLLEALTRNVGRTLTREMILDSVWNNEEALENTVNFHVTSLRKKIDTEGATKLIHTVHGFGYVLRSP
jgi:DNA-binding response OmpR family regulator